MNKVDTFANRLQDLIDSEDITRAEVARVCGIAKSNITKYLSGDYEAKQDIVNMISKKYCVDPAWLMGYDISRDGTIQETEMPAGDDSGRLSEEDVKLLKLFHELTDNERAIVLDVITAVLRRHI